AGRDPGGVAHVHRRVPGAVEHGHRRARCLQPGGRGPPDAAGTPCHDRHPAAVLRRHSPAPTGAAPTRARAPAWAAAMSGRTRSAAVERMKPAITVTGTMTS